MEIEHQRWSDGKANSAKNDKISKIYVNCLDSSQPSKTNEIGRIKETSETSRTNESFDTSEASETSDIM